MCEACGEARRPYLTCSIQQTMKLLGMGAYRTALLDEEANEVHKLARFPQANLAEIEAVIFWNKKQKELGKKWPAWLHTPTDAKVYPCTECAPGNHIVMPYTKGKTLRQILLTEDENHLQRRDLYARVPEAENRYMEIHALGFNDANLSNIVVDEETGDWTIIDLGNE